MPRKKQQRPFFLRLMTALYLYILYGIRVLFPLWRMFFLLRLNLVIPLNARQKHVYIVAGSGSGKSEFIKVFILSLLQLRHKKTTFLIDPHGDTAQEVARFKSHRTGENLAYFSPDLSPEHRFCLNPFDMEPGAADHDINYMAESLTDVFKEIIRGDSSLSGNMETLLHPVLFALLKKPHTTLKDLQQFMRDDQNGDLVAYAIKYCPPGQKHFFQTAFYDAKYTLTKHALYTKIQSLLNSQTFYSLTIGQSTVNIRELMDSGKTVVFNVSKGLIGQQTSPTFGKLIVGLLQGYSFQRQRIPKAQRIPVYVFIDEFQNFVNPSIETILAEGRKYGIHLTLAQQFYGQDTSVSLRGAILNNTAVKIAGTGEGQSLDAAHKFMTGTTKEDLQNLERGRFYVKAKSHSILRQALTENHAHTFRVTTSYLGHRHGMSTADWKTVKRSQLTAYYRRIDGRPEALENSQVSTTLPTPPKKPVQAKYRLPDTPITPKFAL